MNLSVSSSAAHLNPPPHLLSRCFPPDGRGTNPSLLVRSVTSVTHLGAAPQGVSVPAPVPGIMGMSAVAPPIATAADATHLQVNVFWGGVVSERWWVKQASRPIRAEQIRGLFIFCTAGATAAGGWTDKRCSCVRSEVRKRFLTVKVVLWFSVLVRLWQAYRETLTSGVGVGPSGNTGTVSCVKRIITDWGTHTYTVMYCHYFWAFANCWQGKCVYGFSWLLPKPSIQIELHKNVAICLGEVIFMTVCLQGNRLMTLISQSGGIQIHYTT